MSTFIDELVAEFNNSVCLEESDIRELVGLLLAERAELKRDAERYRFLRDLSEQLGNSLFSAVNEWLWGDGPFHDVSEAIDAAMQAAQ
jgi:hypothetical protein